jgi:hypothetical protein
VTTRSAWHGVRLETTGTARAPRQQFPSRSDWNGSAQCKVAALCAEGDTEPPLLSRYLSRSNFSESAPFRCEVAALIAEGDSRCRPSDLSQFPCSI